MPPAACNVVLYIAATVAPGSAVGVVIVSGGTTTCNAKTLFAVTRALSVTVTVNMNGLPVVFGGVPLNAPVPAVRIAQPGGVPAVTAQFVYGGVPPVAANIWLYMLATVAFGSGDAVVIDSGGGATVSVNCFCVVVAGTLLSAT